MKPRPVEIARAVSEHFGVPLAVLMRPRGKRAALRARYAAAYIAEGTRGDSHRAIGAYLNVTGQAVTQGLHRFRKQLRKNIKLREDVTEILNALGYSVNDFSTNPFQELLDEEAA